MKIFLLYADEYNIKNMKFEKMVMGNNDYDGMYVCIQPAHYQEIGPLVKKWKKWKSEKTYKDNNYCCSMCWCIIIMIAPFSVLFQTLKFVITSLNL